jgi:hypothetical protein
MCETVRDVPLSQHTYSSVFSLQVSNGRLDSDLCWASKSGVYGSKHWAKLDLGALPFAHSAFVGGVFPLCICVDF